MRHWIAAWAALAALAAAACGGGEASAPPRTLGPAQPLPLSFAPGTRLALGDPVAQLQLAESGELARLPFAVDWHNMSGGPLSIEAFRAGALDASVVGDTPPIHAHLTGLDVRIIGVQLRAKPSMELALAPGERVASIRDLRGKRIAYSPGQAQGALVLRVLERAGLAPGDVQRVEILGPEFKEALANRQVDAAPLSGPLLYRYLREYAGEGARSIAHEVRDGLSFLYADAAALADLDKAAALYAYVQYRIRAQRWAQAHEAQWVEAYYVKDQGLAREEGQRLLERSGWAEFPTDWSEAIALTQQTIDLFARAAGRPAFRAEELFDRRFESAVRAADGER